MFGETVGMSRDDLRQVCRGTTVMCYQGEGIVASEEKILQMQLPEINFGRKWMMMGQFPILAILSEACIYIYICTYSLSWGYCWDRWQPFEDPQDDWKHAWRFQRPRPADFFSEKNIQSWLLTFCLDLAFWILLSQQDMSWCKPWAMSMLRIYKQS